ncbi:YheC/YheD family protein [Bacillus songklensis]|uniref:YheC/YheD family protein n=1 Tax=Bacillus songklensis TaxID=1069116 RepID=A0ABV8B0Q2_9BACI
MISFGFLTIRPQQEHQYVTEMARRAHQYGITCYRFTPFCIRPEDELVYGEEYDTATNEWKEAAFPLPSFIYDRCFYKHDSISKRAKPIVQWLKMSPLTTFLGHGLPGKAEVYEALLNHPVLSSYIPRTEMAQSSSHIFQTLLKEKAILLKPNNGSQGKGIMAVSIYKKQVKVQSQFGKDLSEISFHDEASFHKWISRKLERVPLLIQPLLNICNYEGKPFDIRVLLQKEESGLWKEAGRGIRQAKNGHILTNISQGAEVLSFDEGLHGFPSSQRKFICEEIDSLIPLIPAALEKAFSPLFELGIDICIDRRGAIWILDMNSKPGRKIVLGTSPEKEEELYCRLLAYCRYLSQKALTV